ncbi:EVE domain-containing protein [Chloroflexota bacterium]
MVFVFQAKPSIYDLTTRLEIGREVGWIASRYRDKMRSGDIVYYWGAGDKKRRGIYGWGNITSKGAFIDSKGTYRVAVTCRKIFPHHINVTELQANPILREIHILRSAMGTNFVLTHEESDALSSLIANVFDTSWIPSEERWHHVETTTR